MNKPDRVFELSLAGYEIGMERGFLPAVDPLPRLPSVFDAWEAAAANLPKLLVSDRPRASIQSLPPFPVERLGAEPEWRRAMMILSYLGHAYVWGEEEPAHRIPAVLAVPWHAVARHLGRPPVLSYASYALDNWRRFDSAGPIELGNIALLQNFLGGLDEEWFILIHVDIEAKAAPALVALAQVKQAIESNDAARVAQSLKEIASALARMYSTLTRMPERCDPYIYYHRVRPYIHGWKNNPVLPDGVLYEGVDEYGGQPQLFRGETGAQSSIIPALDAAFGVGHRDDPLKAYLLEMRDYMPPAHRAFIAKMEEGPTIRDFVLLPGVDGALFELYNDCVGWMERFRSLHLEYAARYIYKQSHGDPANPTAIGTGGTPFMRYLKKHRDETAGHALNPMKHAG